MGRWRWKVVYLKKDLGDKKYEILDSAIVANGSFKMQKPLGDVDERILDINGSTNIRYFGFYSNPCKMRNREKNGQRKRD